MTVNSLPCARIRAPAILAQQIYNKKTNYQIASYLFVPTAWVFLAQKKIAYGVT